MRPIEEIIRYIWEHDPDNWLMSFADGKISVEYFGPDHHGIKEEGAGKWMTTYGFPADVLEALKSGDWKKNKLEDLL